MSSGCFVPNCKGTAGAPFPRDEALRHRWLDALQLLELSPPPGSFVCFGHFRSEDVKSPAGTKFANRVKRGAVPCMPEPCQDPIQHENYDDDDNDDDDDVVDEQESDSDRSLENNGNQVCNEDEEICRACMSTKNLQANVFDLLEDDVTITQAFMMCVFPVKISKNDDLPKHICRSCLNILKVMYRFHVKCIRTNDILQARYGTAAHKRKTSMEVDVNEKKLKISARDADDNSVDEDDLCRVSDIGTSDKYEFVEEASAQVKEEDNLYLPEDHRKVRDPLHIRRNRKLTLKEGDESFYAKFSRKRKFKKESIDIDEIEKNLEEIHGEDEETIQSRKVKDDTENASSKRKEETTVEDILNTLEEGTGSCESEDVLNEFLKKKSPNAPVSELPQKKFVVKSNFCYIYNKDNALQNIKLPKHISIKPVQKHVSATGKFPSCVKTGVYDSTFAEADNYLFEFGLIKGNFRHLRCVTLTCPGRAKQKVLKSGDIVSVIEVVQPHNHQAPDEALKKKQMFLCVMRKKMQNDRTLNIRHIYEDACIEDPEIKQLVPLRNVINEICRHQLTHKMVPINTFETFFCTIESDSLEKLHFTRSNHQFYQEKFIAEEDGSMAILFANSEVIQQVSESKIMYVDASFKIESIEDFKYQLVTILVWVDDSYYPIVFALVDKKSQYIFKKIFAYLRDELAPELRPQEIITDYEANLFYALSEIYNTANVGGSVFYYTQNLYKKICSLNLSRDLETNSYFRNIYHMLLMLPLLPVNTINDALNNIHLEATNMKIQDLALPLFDHVRNQWILNVTPELFCVHKLENRINENVIAPFKKLRDFLLLTKGKLHKTQVSIVHVVEKIIELEDFLKGAYSKPDKKSFGRDLSSFQKKNVLRAWQFIEDHPKIEINNFFSKVLGYIKCMENQLWIWGFYRYDGDTDDTLISASHFSIICADDEMPEDIDGVAEEEYVEYIEAPESTIVMDAVIDQDGVLQTDEETLTSTTVVVPQPQKFEGAYLDYVYQ